MSYKGTEETHVMHFKSVNIEIMMSKKANEVKERWIFSKVVKISDFRILCGWIEKYKPALSKSDSSCDNSYCVS